MSLYPRERYVQILQAAVSSKAYPFAREAAMHWLAAFPGDLKVSLHYAQALMAENRYPQALAILTHVTGADPEFLEAVELLLQAEKLIKGHYNSATLAAILALGGGTPPETVPSWATQLAFARRALRKGEREKANNLTCLSLASDPDSPLVAITHLLVMEADPDVPLAAKRSLGELYHQRYPNSVAPMVMLADWLMKSDETERAVALLHQAAVLDVGGQVPERLWGCNHPYRVMWPERLEVDLPVQIPAAVASVLGWNRLGDGLLASKKENLSPLASGGPVPVAGQPTAAKTMPVFPSTKLSAQETAPVKPEPSAAEGTPANPPPDTGQGPTAAGTPSASETGQASGEPGGSNDQNIYVLFSTNAGLVQQYTPAGATEVRAAMNETARVISARPGWKGMVFLPDDAQYMAQVGLRPANAADAWQLKLALVDLEALLRSKNHRIGAVLIVGGPEVVPYHDLPNPVDDDDLIVPSDSPYASQDENYFIPEWPLGRLPGGAGTDPTFLIAALRRVQAAHSGLVPQLNWKQRLWIWIQRLFGKYVSPAEGKARYSLALSAAIWRKASLAVYQPVGTGQSLAVSPPVDLAEIQSEATRAVIPLPAACMAYFNLHGLPDSPEWFGHRDPLDPEEGKDYPVALRPQDAAASASHPIDIIFSEACYGGHVTGKQPSQAVILRFLEAGTRAVAASSCISYGSISTPLIAADLLGNNFWKLVRAGKPAGAALQEAKIQLVAEMNARQGYLDGEDQKTLISFMLFGDPLAVTSDLVQTGKSAQVNALEELEGEMEAASIPMVKTVCDRADELEMVPGELMTYVKRVVEQYLPGMEGAEVTMSHEHAHCCGEHNCPTGKMKSVSPPDVPVSRKLVLLSKPIVQDQRIHHQYARLTLDASGKLVKLAVSR